jgi:hypothetical protein
LGYLSERLFYDRKNPNKQKALSTLNELVKRFESSSDEEYKRIGLNSLFPSLVDTESENAFPVFEFLINQTMKNENLDNISMFNELENKGEYSVVSKSALNFSYISTIKRLSRSDFDRALNNINKLIRPDSRILIKLPILKRGYTTGDLYHYSNILDYCKP